MIETLGDRSERHRRNTIIRRDIEFYTGMAEQHRDDLRRCAVGDEPLHKQRMVNAAKIYEAMLLYEASLVGM